MKVPDVSLELVDRDGSDVMRERIEQRIAELERERDQFVQQANVQVAAYNAVIGELKRLLEEGEPPQSMKTAEEVSRRNTNGR